MFPVSSQTGLRRLPDTRLTPHEHYGVMLCFVLMLFSYVLVLGSGGTLSVCEIPRQLCRCKNVTGASIDIRLSGK